MKIGDTVYFDVICGGYPDTREESGTVVSFDAETVVVAVWDSRGLDLRFIGVRGVRMEDEYTLRGKST